MQDEKKSPDNLIQKLLLAMAVRLTGLFMLTCYKSLWTQRECQHLGTLSIKSTTVEFELQNESVSRPTQSSFCN